MSHYKERHIFRECFENFYKSYIPNRHDNLKKIIFKVVYLVAFVTLIVSAVYIANYYLESDKQNNIIDDSRNVWHSSSAEETTYVSGDVVKTLLEENSDFKGWIYIKNAKVDHPIYQTDNNSFYLNHNQSKKSNRYGALFFDCKNIISADNTSLNLTIYGHNMKNGSMFGTLKKYRDLSFYKENPTFEFSTIYKKNTYKIFSIFVTNSSPADDNNSVYDYSRQSFLNEIDFNEWLNEAYLRSLINTGVETIYGDNLITLSTCSNDFDNARFVIMAREVREGEEKTVNTKNSVVNPSPKYPKRWYDDRKID